jgi:hypothetical protein
MLRVAWWDDDDATMHDRLRMRIANLTKPNRTCLQLMRQYAVNDWRMARWISLKFGGDVTPL